MANPEYGKGLIHLVRANALNAGAAVVYNEITSMDGGLPIKMSAGSVPAFQYGTVTSDASNPTYVPSFHTTTRLTQVFNNLYLFGSLDVVTVIDGAQFNPLPNPGPGRMLAGLKIETEEDDEARAYTAFTINTTPDTYTVDIYTTRDNPSPDATHYASASIFTSALTSENAAGFGSETCTLTTIADFAYGGAAGIGTTGSQGGQACRLSWRPWNSRGIATPSTGVPQWVAIRYHKYEPAFPNQHKISVCASWDNTVRTLTFSAFGSMVGTGIPVNAPQNSQLNLICRATLAYDIASESKAWEVAAKEQGDQWAGTTDNKSVTPYYAALRSSYKRFTGPQIDQTTGTYYDVQGKLVAGKECEIKLPSAAVGQDYNVVGGWPSDANTQAGLWLTHPDGRRVPQYIRNWGRNVLNYLGRTTAGISVADAGIIRFVFTVGSITDVRGCSLEVRNAAGTIIFAAPISNISYDGEVASAAAVESSASLGTPTLGPNGWETSITPDTTGDRATLGPNGWVVNEL